MRLSAEATLIETFYVNSMAANDDRRPQSTLSIVARAEATEDFLRGHLGDSSLHSSTSANFKVWQPVMIDSMGSFLLGSHEFEAAEEVSKVTRRFITAQQYKR